MIDGHWGFVHWGFSRWGSDVGLLFRTLGTFDVGDLRCWVFFDVGVF